MPRFVAGDRGRGAASSYLDAAVVVAENKFLVRFVSEECGHGRIPAWGVALEQVGIGAPKGAA